MKHEKLDQFYGLEEGFEKKKAGHPGMIPTLILTEFAVILARAIAGAAYYQERLY